MARAGLRSRLSAALSRLVRRPAPAGSVAGPRSVADEIGYAPRPDGMPDPGEIVWGWVPYDEGEGRGKDRPGLVICRRGPHHAGLQLTSKDHHRDADDEARWGRYWADLGTGDWD